MLVSCALKDGSALFSQDFDVSRRIAEPKPYRYIEQRAYFTVGLLHVPISTAILPELNVAQLRDMSGRSHIFAASPRYAAEICCFLCRFNFLFSQHRKILCAVILPGAFAATFLAAIIADVSGNHLNQRLRDGNFEKCALVADSLLAAPGDFVSSSLVPFPQMSMRPTTAPAVTSRPIRV
jgi:hypothetical protein